MALKEIYLYIRADSPQSAVMVKQTLLALAKSIGNFPEKFAKEAFLEDEPFNFRSVTKWHYKMIYEITENEVIIIDIFHTSQHPSKMKKVR